MNGPLLQAWEKTLRTRGGKRAVVDAGSGATCTFRELDARAIAWTEKHVPEPECLRGRAVVFAVANGIGWLEMFLAFLRAEAVIAPLDGAEPVAARRRSAEALRAACWWDGTRLVPLPGSRRFRGRALRLVKLTSGTTGEPRPLIFTEAQLLADARQVTSTMGIGPGDLNYGLIPLGHSYGLGNLTIPLIAQGVPLVCGSVPLPHAIAADFVRWRPTVFPSVPAVWRALAASDSALKSLRLGISAGAPLPAEVARAFAARFGQPLHNFYGSSETGGIAYDATGEATLKGGVGRALRGVKLSALQGQRLGVGSGAVVTHGNRRRVGKRGTWVMADRVQLDAHGRLTLLGRRGTTVKIAGRRVNLAEVTARLKLLPGVREAWVGVGTGGESVLGTVVAADRPVADLRLALHADTATWKIPKKWIVLPALPMTARGKPDTRALQALLWRS